MPEQVTFEEERFDPVSGLRTGSLQQEMQSVTRVPFLVRTVIMLRLARTKDQANKIIIGMCILLLAVALYSLKVAMTPDSISYLQLK